MSIKKFETRNALKKKLRARNLVFDDKKLEETLVSHNYFNLFNGLETIFLEIPTPKFYYKNTKLKDFLYLYNFDKEIRAIISRYLDAVEEKLKASISYHFCKRHCTTLGDTMQYTNKEHYMDPANGVVGTPTYCRYSSTYPFVSFQNYAVYSSFDSFCLFRVNYLTNLIRFHDHIDESFYQDMAYVAPPNVAVYRDRYNVINNHVAVPFWVAIETLMFGELVRLLHYLQDDVMEDVLKDFDLPLSKRTEFLNMIDFLWCLRNSCAHTSLVNRFRTDERYHISNLLISAFSLTPKNTHSILKLFDVIKILSYFIDVSDLKKPMRNLRKKMWCSLGIIKGQETYNKVLSRMGCGSYKEWMRILSGEKYIL